MALCHEFLDLFANRLLLLGRQLQIVLQTRQHPRAAVGRIAVARRLAARLEAERVVGHAQRVVLLGHFDLHVRGHARKELAVIVQGFDDDGVGDDIIQFRRRQANLGHLAVECPVWVRVNCERDLVALGNNADVGFIDLRFDADTLNVLGNLEQLRRLQAGRNRLPDIDRA